ncbi:MAG TPA: HNH endonuclease [Jiangellaceae bacterium]|nr:HNH endonuclease [Jiangellaceae bacterium]
MIRTQEIENPYPESMSDEGVIRELFPDYAAQVEDHSENPMPRTARDWSPESKMYERATDKIVSQNLRDEMGGSLTRQHWDKLRLAFDHRCAYCGKRQRWMVIEHVVPISKSGRTSPDNTLPACWRCNCAKASLELHQWQDSPLWWFGFLGRLLNAAEKMGEMAT